MGRIEIFDWLRATNADRVLLFYCVKDLIDRGAITWNELFHRALERHVGQTYVENFRRGLNSRKDCLRLFNFLRENFPMEASELESVLSDQSYETAWQSFFDEHRKDGCIKAVLDEEADLNAFADAPERHHFTKRQAVHLQLDSPIDGYAICLRGDMNTWHWQSVTWATPFRVQKGRQWLTGSRNAETPLLFATKMQTCPPSPIYGEDLGWFQHFAVIITDLATSERIAKACRLQSPVRERILEALPAVIRSSASPWVIAWTILHFRDAAPRELR